MINCSHGEEFLIDGLLLTRIEFRLGRDALKHLRIDTIADLEEKESSLAEWLPRNWFRLLEEPAVRGHENTAAGCIAKAVVLTYRVQETVANTMERAMLLLRTLGDTMLEKVNTLPDVLRQKLIGRKWIEGTPAEKFLTIDQLIEEHQQSRVIKTKAARDVDKRHYCYLRKHFGGNTSKNLRLIV
ncbi:hypothetical protein FACS189419_10030 [Planctomycetales bacterium]|nr:hypothetical protein FACS189419_10030 [Planctomycetales bacterium]